MSVLTKKVEVVSACPKKAKTVTVDLDDYLELQDSELKEKIRENYEAYRRGEARPVEELIAELQRENAKK